ncbi:oxidoreductase domain-containing protein [Microdochium bolleyi]|uniref:Oxidoreductase domain-containing protein n=1 Tax=Microdochium bolleyi TaxID=196109 RepID=A0A136IYJ7_9PEZI|nr:oxidoreductase domain-containing protein [Microdochium bolleyi]
MPPNKIKVGVVGYGNSARTFHLPFITAIPDYEVVAILQRAEAPQPGSAEGGKPHCTVDFPGVRHYREPEPFFADEEIQFVVVVTHTNTHPVFAEQALRAGKHVLVDKPFAGTSEQIDKVIQLAEEKGLIATCYQNRRWDGGFQTLRSLMGKDALGEVKEAEIYYDFENPGWLHHLDKAPFSPSAGMAFGLGTHSVDQALTLFGRPESVTGFFRNQRGSDSKNEDSFTIVLQYRPRSELLVTVKTSIVSPLSKQVKFMVRGTKGSYVKYQQRSTCPQEEHAAARKSPLDADFAAEPASLDGTLTTVDEFDGSCQRYDGEIGKYTGAYPTITGRWMGLYENVAAAIRGEAELEVKLQQSRDAIRVLELARESSDEGRTVAWR